MSPRPLLWPSKLSWLFRDIKQPSVLSRKGAVLIVLQQSLSGSLYWPLILRHSYDGVHSDQVSLPGGKYENSDESLMHTALRETGEELGISISENDIIGKLSSLYIFPSDFIVEPWLALLDNRLALKDYKPDSYEVRDVFHMQYNDLYSTRRQKLKILRNIPMHVPYFKVEGQVIWGATAMILSELAEVFTAVNV